jgi:hypothetical protein
VSYSLCRYNDVTKIIDQTQLRGRFENNDVYDELAELSAVVIDTRKRYDEKRTNASKLQHEIDKLRK